MPWKLQHLMMKIPVLCFNFWVTLAPMTRVRGDGRANRVSMPYVTPKEGRFQKETDMFNRLILSFPPH